ncbi:unnamed protein product [Caretta caretta]
MRPLTNACRRRKDDDAVPHRWRSERKRLRGEGRPRPGGLGQRQVHLCSILSANQQTERKGSWWKMMACVAMRLRVCSWHPRGSYPVTFA